MIEDLQRVYHEVFRLRQEIASLRGLKPGSGSQQPSNDETTIPEFKTLLDRKKFRSDQNVQETIQRAGSREGIDPDLIRSIIQVESGFDAEAVSSDGARGLMQLMPATARELGVDPDDVSENILGGTRYLGGLIDRFGHLDLALAAYNAGPGAVDSHRGIPPYEETRGFVNKVLENYRQRKKEQP